jgi:channel protein (hemolysin III family)
VSLSGLFGPQPVSALSHLVAAGVALVAAIPLVRSGRGHPGRSLVLAIYAGCVVAALTISGVYHSLDPDGFARLFMQRLDHCAIWCLIAATFTGIHGIMWKGFWRGGVLGFIWSYALVGIVLKIFWFQAFFGALGLALYLGLGCVGVASAYKLGRELGWAGALPMLAAGLAYSAGAILDAFEPPPFLGPWLGAHEVFHFAVVAGIALQWLLIRKLLAVSAAAAATISPAPSTPTAAAA